MVLEILIDSSYYLTDPADTVTGEKLYATIITNISFGFSTAKKSYTVLSGKPYAINLGQKPSKITIEGYIQEYGTTDLDTASLGLKDLDVIRRAMAEPKIWLRDTEGEYFLRNWKGGIITNLSVKPAQKYRHSLGNVLYVFSFDFVESLAEDSHHKLARYV